MTDRKHAELPWRIIKNSNESWIGGEDGGLVNHISHDNAEFIVRACNSHYENEALRNELVEALELFVSEYTDLVNSGDAGFWDPEEENKVVKARAVLKKAKGDGASLARGETQ